ncbi:MAG: hypothetical protein CM1200mP41_22850 [Gammaproteobacteria bacterium]|nr:MAG: hypothetical protein CM1200mP41_22850 [Gammaproteobacteria bacterium]
MADDSRFVVAIDVGGTFTDVILIDGRTGERGVLRRLQRHPISLSAFSLV